MKFKDVVDNLNILKLDKMANCLSEYVDKVNSENIAFLDALFQLTKLEIANKAERSSQFNIRIAHFPYYRTFDDFDFSFQPSVNKEQVLELASLRFIEEKKNVLLIGSPGTGKTHIATAIGIEAAKNRVSTYFISCHDLISQLSLAHSENRLVDKIKQYNRYKLLIIDEVGYLPVDKTGANLLFQLLAKRYEKYSTIVTSNQQFSKWGEVLSDATLASAILDRLLHHSYVFNITGNSYRIKDKILEKRDNNVVY